MDTALGKGIYRVSCGEATQAQAMDTPTVKAIYVINPIDGSQTQVMDELVANFFSPAWTATADPDDGYQLQFMDDMEVLFTTPPTGIGSRVAIFAQSRSVISTGQRMIQVNKRDDVVAKRG
jgi:hypothetical protein